MPIWNKEELLRDWKESIIVAIYKKGDDTDCSNYRGISLLQTTYRILSNILLPRIRRGNHWGSSMWISTQYDRPATDHIFCNRLILEKKWEYNKALHLFFMDFQKNYDSIMREVLYSH